MARVKIKHPKPREPAVRTNLLEILSKHHVYATKIIPLDDSLIVLTSDTNEAEKIFCSRCNDDLQNHRFTPILPPDLKANRTIIVTRLDDYIYNHEEEDIKEELKRQNSWIESGIVEIFKFPKSNTMKITYDHHEKAKKSTSQGLLMYHMRVPPHQIHQDEYVNLQTCMKCYKIEDHHTNQCPKSPDYQICSECGENGHQYRSCNRQQKKCINCGGPHRTLAMKCPLRKKELREKRNINKVNTNSYSNAAQIPMMKPPQIHMEKEMTAKILSCMLHAHLMNVGNPGTYEKVLNQTLTVNNLPPIKIPEVPQSANILNLSIGSDINTTLGNKMSQARAPEQDNTNQPKMRHQLQGQDIGLQIIASQKEGWPKKELKSHTLRDSLERRKLKWTYTDNTYEEDTIFKLICTNDINLNGCWSLVEDSEFRKTRPGLIRLHSPEPSRDPRIRKTST